MGEQTRNRPSVQDAFLNAARKAGVPLGIFVTNGYHIAGARVISFDSYAILAEAGGRQMLIYKHAVSTITPEEPFVLDPAATAPKEEGRPDEQ